jgi:hypothetical protein
MSKQTHEERAVIIRERAKEANEHNARELELCAQNTSEIYFAVITPTIASLRRHAKRGKYSEAAALVAWKNAADNAARLYMSIYCGKGERVGDVFSVADRCAVAVTLCETEAENVFFGLNA